jgi:hypothetical protein
MLLGMSISFVNREQHIYNRYTTRMAEHKKARIKPWHMTLLIVGIAVCLGIWVVVGYEFYSIRARYGLSPHQFFRGNIFSERRQNAYPTRADFIQSWMTFDYINLVFHLPSDILKEQLSITDPHYPHITLEKYAAMHSLNQTVFLNQIRSAIATYMNLQ